MKFYILNTLPHITQSSSIVDAYRVHMENLGDAPRCPLCNCYIGGREILPPYDIELELIGKEFGDIIDFSGGCILISEMFLESWNKSKLIGLSGFFNVSVLRVKNNRKQKIVPPLYFLANITRSRTAIDAKRSVLIRENGEICPECRLGGGIKRVARVVIERNSWAGEDIFIARGMPGTVIVTEYFKEFCENNEIKNAVLIEAEKYFFDFYRSEN